MLERFIGPSIESALSDTPVVLVHGPRQSGKTTLVRQVAERHAMRYVTLDDGAALAAAGADPDGFIAGLGARVVLDEVQRVPDLLRAVKASVDRDRRPGRFLLTGSANVMMLPTASESLAGRMETITLLPLSQGELVGVRESFIDRLFSPGDWQSVDQADHGDGPIQRALVGGYPEVVSRRYPALRRAWFDAYVAAVLHRDIRDLAAIEQLSEMPRLLSLIASRSAGILNFADLSRSLGLAQSTLKRYYALLEATFIVAALPAWFGNPGLRLIKSPKLHLVDSGLLGALMDITPERLRATPALAGPLLETFVVGEVLRQRGWSTTRVRAHHFRTGPGREVDLVLEDASGRVAGIEVKAGATINSRDFAGLRALRDAAGERFVRGVILSGVREPVPFEGHTLLAAPIHTLWAPASP